MKDEKLSAFLDGELEAHELDDLLEQFRSDGNRDQFRRLAAAQTALAGGQPGNLDLSQAVARAIRDEAPPQRKIVPLLAARRRRFQVPAAGWAVAASVVFAAVLIVSQGPAGAPAPQLTASAEAGPAVASPSPVSAPASSPIPVAAPAAGNAPRLAAPVMQVSTGRPASATPAPGTDPERELVIAAPGERWTSAGSSEARRQLDTLLINHARYGGGYVLGGRLGYARVAAQTGTATGDDDR